MKKLHVGDKVTVNKDIFRLEERFECDARLKALGIVKPEVGSLKTLEEYQAIDWSLFRRKQIQYATQGEVGEVVEIFRDWQERNRFYAKVKIGEKIKTFRQTSLDLI